MKLYADDIEDIAMVPPKVLDKLEVGVQFEKAAPKWNMVIEVLDYLDTADQTYVVHIGYRCPKMIGELVKAGQNFKIFNRFLAIGHGRVI